jgi:hypothetical protein
MSGKWFSTFYHSLSAVTLSATLKTKCGLKHNSKGGLDSGKAELEPGLVKRVLKVKDSASSRDCNVLNQSIVYGLAKDIVCDTREQSDSD